MATLTLLITVQCGSAEEYDSFLVDAEASYGVAEIEEYQSEFRFVLSKQIET